MERELGFGEGIERFENCIQNGDKAFVLS